MEHAKHVARAVVLLVLAGLLFVVVRHFAIPETFGMHGHYRFASVAEHAAKPPTHGDVGACGDCHEEETQTVSEGKHGTVSCEVCHAPLGGHVRDGEQVAPMPVRRSLKLCGWCHHRLEARPTDFPQIVLQQHVTEKGEEMSADVCLECHDAHNPGE